MAVLPRRPGCPTPPSGASQQLHTGRQAGSAQHAWCTQACRALPTLCAQRTLSSRDAAGGVLAAPVEQATLLPDLLQPLGDPSWAAAGQPPLPPLPDQPPPPLPGMSCMRWGRRGSGASCRITRDRKCFLRLTLPAMPVRGAPPLPLQGVALRRCRRCQVAGARRRRTTWGPRRCRRTPPLGMSTKWIWRRMRARRRCRQGTTVTLPRRPRRMQLTGHRCCSSSSRPSSRPPQQAPIRRSGRPQQPLLVHLASCLLRLASGSSPLVPLLTALRQPCHGLRRGVRLWLHSSRRPRCCCRQDWASHQRRL